MAQVPYGKYPNDFVKLFVYDLYVFAFADQEIISIAAHILAYNMYVTRKPKLIYCYANYLQGSKEKFR